MKKQWTPSEMGKKGGKKSVQSRFKGRTKEQISEMMSAIRNSKVDKKHAKAVAEDSVRALRRIR
jgi:hypothetical protein